MVFSTSLSIAGCNQRLNVTTRPLCDPPGSFWLGSFHSFFWNLHLSMHDLGHPSHVTHLDVSLLGTSPLPPTWSPGLCLSCQSLCPAEWESFALPSILTGCEFQESRDLIFSMSITLYFLLQCLIHNSVDVKINKCGILPARLMPAFTRGLINLLLGLMTALTPSHLLNLNGEVRGWLSFMWYSSLHIWRGVSFNQGKFYYTWFNEVNNREKSLDYLLLMGLLGQHYLIFLLLNFIGAQLTCNGVLVSSG